MAFDGFERLQNMQQNSTTWKKNTVTYYTMSIQELLNYLLEYCELYHLGIKYLTCGIVQIPRSIVTFARI